MISLKDIDWNRITSLTSEEKRKVFDENVEFLYKMVEEIRIKGIGCVDDIISKAKDDFLEISLILLTFGSYEEITRVLMTIVNSSNISNLYYFKRIVQIEAIILCKEGINLLDSYIRLVSYFGDDYTKHSISYYNAMVKRMEENRLKVEQDIKAYNEDNTLFDRRVEIEIN